MLIMIESLTMAYKLYKKTTKAGKRNEGFEILSENETSYHCTTDTNVKLEVVLILCIFR